MAAPLLTRADAAHLLRRVGFGGKNNEIDALVGLTRTVAVDRVMDLSTAPPVARPAGIDQPSSQWGAWVAATTWWLQRMVDTPMPLQEQMVLFWHGHFATQQSKVGEIAYLFDQQQTFRSLGLGSFRDLVQAVAVDKAMLIYLDNATNNKYVPQENFARELMELFTLGVGNYTEADVAAVAKAWTGHNQTGWVNGVFDASYKFWPTRHDTTNKTIFGITKNWDGPDVVDELVLRSKQSVCAAFIAKKLFAYFANTTPSDTTVGDLTAAFVGSNMNIAALVRAILLHDEFWGPNSRLALVKSPVEFVVSMMRRTGLAMPDAGLTWSLPPMGQVPFDPPNVAGWGQNGYWLTTANLWGRGTWLNYIQWGLGPTPTFGALSSMTPATGTQALFDILGIDAPSAATRARVEAWWSLTRSSA